MSPATPSCRSDRRQARAVHRRGWATVSRSGMSTDLTARPARGGARGRRDPRPFRHHRGRRGPSGRDPAQDRRPGRDRSGQRRRTRRHRARCHGRQRADVQHQHGRRARSRADALRRAPDPRGRRHPAHREWKRSKFNGVEIFGKTVGVVGLGRIGQLFAQRLAAFGSPHRLRPVHRARPRRPARHRAAHAGGAARARRHHLDPPAEDSRDGGADRQGPACAHQAGRDRSSTPPAAASSTRTPWPRP